MVAVDHDVRAAAYRAWLDAGYHGEMAYMASADHVAARSDARRILEGARSLVAVVAAYGARDPEPDDDRLRGRVARYARGADYHQVLKRSLYALAGSLATDLGADFAARPCVDSAPVLERGFAEAAGVGFVGKNTMLISPGLGSFTVLGELFTDLEIAPTRRLDGRGCGDCRACLDACPTGAITAPFALDARRCVSYLTIEHRGPIPAELRPAIGDMIFGCDICQQVCPYNAAAPARVEPTPELADDSLDAARPDLGELSRMGSSAWKRWSAGRATRRAGRAGLMRNVAIALGNSGDRRAREGLERLAGDRSEVVREAARWGLSRTGDKG